MTTLEMIGVITAIGGAIAAIDKWIVQPLKHITSKLDKIEKIEEGQKILMRAQAQTMEHLISGNNVNELKEQYDKLLDYAINN